MKTGFARIGRAATGALLAGSMLIGAAVPAGAQYRGGGWHDRGYHRDRDGISAGEVIAGAIVIGGLAAILSSGNRDRRYDDRNGRWDRGYDDRGYDWRRHGGSRAAIERCVSAVERRGGRRDDVDVTRITGVDRLREGYRIEGRVAVDYRGGYRGDPRDGYRGDGRWGGDRGQNYDDRGSFSCTVRYGQIDDLRIRGV